MSWRALHSPLERCSRHQNLTFWPTNDPRTEFRFQRRLTAPSIYHSSQQQIKGGMERRHNVNADLHHSICTLVNRIPQ